MKFESITDLLLAHGYAPRDSSFCKTVSGMTTTIPFEALAGHNVESLEKLAATNGWLNDIVIESPNRTTNLKYTLLDYRTSELRSIELTQAVDYAANTYKPTPSSYEDRKIPDFPPPPSPPRPRLLPEKDRILESLMFPGMSQKLYNFLLTLNPFQLCAMGHDRCLFISNKREGKTYLAQVYAIYQAEKTHQAIIPFRYDGDGSSLDLLIRYARDLELPRTRKRFFFPDAHTVEVFSEREFPYWRGKRESVAVFDNPTVWPDHYESNFLATYSFPIGRRDPDFITACIKRLDVKMVVA